MADEVELLQVMCQGYSICFKLQLSDSWLRIHFLLGKKSLSYMDQYALVFLPLSNFPLANQ